MSIKIYLVSFVTETLNLYRILCILCFCSYQVLFDSNLLNLFTFFQKNYVYVLFFDVISKGPLFTYYVSHLGILEKLTGLL